MNAYKFILFKQTQWALNQGINLVGSKGERGRKIYTPTLDENLFMPMSQSIVEQFEKGDGSEVAENSVYPSKMQALHSSSALSVNIFQFWQDKNQASEIASACGFCERDSDIPQTICFEDKYTIDKKFRYSPNIDVVIHNRELSQVKRFAIECKFTEAYSSYKHDGLKEKYLEIDQIWFDIPKLRGFAELITPSDNSFCHLHPAQLIKHILALKVQFQKSGFKLLYLWYDALGEAGNRHRNEIEQFTKILDADGIKFLSMSYQELIGILSSRYRREHKSYVQYLTERYL